ncbi:hypothetical protein R54767_01289 [Paraburkholderia gardini]|uniref:Uncharacterized protein n=1 Tax=Paraburkholderia gardini TaxID=2823469 RepID=A0ABM8U0I1_9BURK|nr:hypothetical protein R54767_01289 [Paraburkholderia gardini]
MATAHACCCPASGSALCQNHYISLCDIYVLPQSREGFWLEPARPRMAHAVRDAVRYPGKPGIFREPFALRRLSAWAGLFDATQYKGTARPCFRAKRGGVEFGVGTPPFGSKVLVAAHGWSTRDSLVQYVPASLETVALTGEVMSRVASWRSAVHAVATRYDPDCPRLRTRACDHAENAQYRQDTVRGSGERRGFISLVCKCRGHHRQLPVIVRSRSSDCSGCRRIWIRRTLRHRFRAMMIRAGKDKTAGTYFDTTISVCTKYPGIRCARDPQPVGSWIGCSMSRERAAFPRSRLPGYGLRGARL